MELSEGKLFTIEALNRIEGFEWPDGAAFAAMNGMLSFKLVHFYFSKPITEESSFSGIEIICADAASATPHPDWKNSLITRAEFELVDGWVRNDLRLIPDCAYEKRVDFVDPECVVWIDYDATMLEWAGRSDGGYVVKWRYHKPQTQVKQPATQPVSNIETLISQHKAAKQSTLEARRLLEHAEAIEHNLLLSIEAWAESNGFDIRVLDEVQEAPDLVITDWRDLRVGDEVLITNCESNRYWKRFADVVCKVACVSDVMDGVIFNHKAIGDWWLTAGTSWKFIRRPAKGEK